MNIWFYASFLTVLAALFITDKMRTNCRRCYKVDYRFDIMSKILMFGLFVVYSIDLVAVTLHIIGALK